MQRSSLVFLYLNLEPETSSFHRIFLLEYARIVLEQWITTASFYVFPIHNTFLLFLRNRTWRLNHLALLSTSY